MEVFACCDQEYCQEESGHLASVNTPVLEDYVHGRQVDKRGLGNTRFGGNDIKEEVVWKWTTHTP